MPDECRRCVAWVLYAPCTCQMECSSELCAAMDQKPSPTASGPTHYHACNLAICADRGVDESRLLPSGGEVSTQWEVRSVLQDGFVTPSQFDNEFSARDLIEKLRASNMQWVKRIDLARRSVTIWPDGSNLLGPWSPVLSDNSEVPA